MSQRRLYVGVDLRNDFTQVSILLENQEKPEHVETSNHENGIPTVVKVPGTQQVVENFLEKIYRDEPIMVLGKECDPVNVLAAFLRKTLSLTRKSHPGEMIRNLVITTEYKDFKYYSLLYLALEKLGIEKDRAMVVDRKQSFIYYVLSQKKELWINYVSIFDYDSMGLHYLQMQCDRLKRPSLVTVSEKDYSDYIEMFEGDDNTPEEKETIFENMVQGALRNQVITSLFMTGAGFKSGFADGVMPKLCTGRHLFQGDNLYVDGACYQARENGGGRKMPEFIYLDEDMIASHISMKVYTDAKEQEVRIAKAGTPWYQVNTDLDLIPDGEDEIQIHIYNVLTKESSVRLLPLEAVEGRNRRQVRVSLQVQFAGTDKCIITMRDKGFGDFFPSSHRIWEEIIML